VHSTIHAGILIETQNKRIEWKALCDQGVLLFKYLEVKSITGGDNGLRGSAYG
jgi:hypothetical protein